MTLPVGKLTYPSDVTPAMNGKLNPNLLTPCGVGNFKMHHLASRAIKAMNYFLSVGGHLVRSTGTYRSYDQQVALFLDRYSPTPISGRPTKVWNGKTYWQKPGVAMAAVPGQSNHGWGLAIDYAEELDGDPQIESISQAMVNWLVQNAAKFGFSAEAQSEPWHWRYNSGDNLPQAVLDYEKGTSNEGEDEMKPYLVRQKGFANIFVMGNGPVTAIGGEIMAQLQKDYPGIPKIFQDHLPSFYGWCSQAGLNHADINQVVPYPNDPGKFE